MVPRSAASDPRRARATAAAARRSDPRRRLWLGADAGRARALRRGSRDRAQRRSRRRCAATVAMARCSSAGSRSFRTSDGTFDLITCLDVIEHTPDDRVTLAELRRVAVPGGWLLVTVPAYQALWSAHDEANHHYRRYSRRTLRAVAMQSGWEVARMTSFNSLLLAPAAAVRIAQRRRPANGDGASALQLGPVLAQRGAGSAASARGALDRARPHARRRAVPDGGAAQPRRLMIALAALISVSPGLGYALPAIVGLESMGIPSPGETALIARCRAGERAQAGHRARDRDRVSPRRSSATTSATSSAAGSAAKCSRRRGRFKSGASGCSPPGSDSSPSTVQRRCSSAAGSRSCGSRPRGWPESSV